MTVQKTIQIGNPILRTKCSEVTFPLSDDVRSLVVDLTDTMRAAGLVGLAAPQLGVNARVFVLEIPEREDRERKESELFVCINPVIVRYADNIVYGNEGCGSIARGQLFGSVPRPEWSEIEYVDLQGDVQKRRLEGLHSVVALHEIDHLDGILFLDRMDDPKELFDSSQYKHAPQEADVSE